MFSSSSLSQFASLIPENLSELTKALPLIGAAAEAVHEGFEGLLFNHVQLDPNNIPLGTALTMGFGAHLGWVEAYIMTGAGHIGSGWANMRRAIEFTAYATKVVNSEKRAKYWMHQRTDVEARKRFSSECSIPLCYTTQKYRLLRPLLVAYDTASYFGVHANLESLVTKYRESTDKHLLFSYQDDQRGIPSATSLIILLGFRSLQVLTEALKGHLTEPAKHEAVMQYVAASLKAVRLQLASSEYKGDIPGHVLKAIHSDDNPEIDRMFQGLIEREKERKSKLGPESP